MTLYELNDQIAKAIELGFDPETGEILDDSALRDLEMARDEKIENICLFVKDLKAEAEALKNEERGLSERRKSSEKKAESLTNYLKAMLNGEKFKTSKCSVSYRRTQAVQITDETLLPDCYIRRKVTEEPDKVAIKETLKAGGEVAGACLEERQSMTIK